MICRRYLALHFILLKICQNVFGDKACQTSNIEVECEATSNDKDCCVTGWFEDLYILPARNTLNQLIRDTDMTDNVTLSWSMNFTGVNPEIVGFFVQYTEKHNPGITRCKVIRILEYKSNLATEVSFSARLDMPAVEPWITLLIDSAIVEDWKGEFMLQLKNRTYLTVHFDTLSDVLEYYVMLFTEEGIPVQGTTTKRSFISFQDVEPGRYYIEVSVRNERLLLNDPEKCPCSVHFGETRICQSCEVLTSEVFDYPSKAISDITEKPSVFIYDTNSSLLLESEREMNSFIVPAVTPPVILLFICCLVFCLCRKYHDFGCLCLHDNNTSRFQVSIVATEDHHHHIKAVQQLAEFLRKMFNCEVVLISTFPNVEASRVHFQNQILNKNSYLIIVSSRKAFSCYEQWRNMGVKCSDKLSKDSSIFISALEVLAKGNTSVHNVIQIKFPYTHSSHMIGDLRFGAVFLLLNELAGLSDYFLKHVDKSKEQIGDYFSFVRDNSIVFENFSAIVENGVIFESSDNFKCGKELSASLHGRGKKLTITTEDIGLNLEPSVNKSFLPDDIESHVIDRDRETSNHDFLYKGTCTCVMCDRQKQILAQTACYNSDTTTRNEILQADFMSVKSDDDFDVQSHTLSECMKNINERYECSLSISEVIDSCAYEEAISLGGKSV